MLACSLCTPTSVVIHYRKVGQKIIDKSRGALGFHEQAL